MSSPLTSLESVDCLLQVSNRLGWREALEDGSYNSFDKELPQSTAVSADTEDGDLLVVRDLSRALLQIQRAIDKKYLAKPLGEFTILKSRRDLDHDYSYPER